VDLSVVLYKNKSLRKPQKLQRSFSSSFFYYDLTIAARVAGETLNVMSGKYKNISHSRNNNLESFSKNLQRLPSLIIAIIKYLRPSIKS